MRPVRKWREPQKAPRLKPVKLAAAAVVPLFSEDRRNAVRGALADARRQKLTPATINRVRANKTEADMLAAAKMLEGPGGLRDRRNFQLKQADIPLAHDLGCRSSDLEIAYACGLVNAWPDDARAAIATISILSRLSEVDIDDAIGALSETARTWGASSYLAHKMTYVREFTDLTDSHRVAFRSIDDMLGQSDSPLIQYSAYESLKPTISIFVVGKRYTNILIDHINGDFRRFYALNNIIATPISDQDVGGFLLRAVETSFIDTVRSIWLILNLKESLQDACDAVERNLDPDIYQILKSHQHQVGQQPLPDVCQDGHVIALDDGVDDDIEDRSLSYYRRASAFLEYPGYAIFRHDVDRVIGQRLLASLLPAEAEWSGPDFSDKSVLLQVDGRFDFLRHGETKLEIDNFYRTYLFLRLIQNPVSLSLITGSEIQFIFNNTMRLEALLTENELSVMHINASDEARALISVLALALYRSKSSDPDIDFDFRENFQDYIVRNFDGKISRFINDLAPKSPEVAHYIVGSLDEVTLQKMYQIVTSSAQAEDVRREILTSVGVNLNKIEYIIEAEAIATRSKVSKLKSYFDASRMYVDSVAMKRWLSSNPSAYADQFKELLPKLVARVSGSKNIVSSSGNEATVGVLEITSTDIYLVERMATDAFREFCVNNEFGIESYLGRRIRHNTLQGVMTKSVDAVLQRPEYQPVIFRTPFGDALRVWESVYKLFIERLRKEFLQFRSESRPNALFDAGLDLSDSVTKRNLQQLVQTLSVSGPEMLEELMVTFCWRQIAPQLDAASRQIRVKMTQEMNQALDQALQKFNGPEELKVKSALADGVASVFGQIAGWFQVPQTGFVPASISDIVNILDIEHNRASFRTEVSGELEGVKYYGLSVHRLYDCLAVLLGNAFKHGRDGRNVKVFVSAAPIIGTNLHNIDISVQSVLPKESRDCVARVKAALTSVETGKDMVTEGYSGIKKVKFITRLNEGEPTVSCDVIDDVIDIRFKLKSEVAESDVEV